MIKVTATAEAEAAQATVTHAGVATVTKLEPHVAAHFTLADGDTFEIKPSVSAAPPAA